MQERIQVQRFHVSAEPYQLPPRHASAKQMAHVGLSHMLAYYIRDKRIDQVRVKHLVSIEKG